MKAQNLITLNSMIAFETPKELVDFLAKHRLSSDQFLFMFLIYTEDYTSLYKYTENVKGLMPQEIQDLVRRGYLINANRDPDQYWADSFVVTETFTSEIFKNANDAASEFWNTYPSVIYVDGRRFSGKTADKEEFFERYMKKIGYSNRRHSKVMSALKYGIDRNVITMGIDKWFKSEQWNQLEEEMRMNSERTAQYGDKEF
jgi:hypothetical protein